MDLTQDDIAELQRLLEGSAYEELTVESGRMRITLRRSPDGSWHFETQTLAQASLVSPVKQMAAVSGSLTQEGATTAEGLINVFPPLPGTFYRAPKPGAAPFVDVGSTVTEDMVIGIIETMKLMNPARAKTAGTIVEICAANGELVEETSVLMRVRAHAGVKP